MGRKAVDISSPVSFKHCASPEESTTPAIAETAPPVQRDAVAAAAVSFFPPPPLAVGGLVRTQSIRIGVAI
jgi:hypothetical protein